MTNDKAAPSNSAIQKLKIALIQSGQAQNPSAVSYTHLTLPTSDLV